MDDLSPGTGSTGPGPFPTVSTQTGTILAPSELNAPGVAIVESDARRPDAAGEESTTGNGKAMSPRPWTTPRAG